MDEILPDELIVKVLKGFYFPSILSFCLVLYSHVKKERKQGWAEHNEERVPVMKDMKTGWKQYVKV